MNFYLRHLGGNGTNLWDRPHRFLCDWSGGKIFAGLTVGDKEWEVVLSLRKGPFVKQAWVELFLPR